MHFVTGGVSAGRTRTMRIIDADALKADLKQYFTDGVLDGISARLAFNQILHDIDNAPTIAEYIKGKELP